MESAASWAGLGVDRSCGGFSRGDGGGGVFRLGLASEMRWVRRVVAIVSPFADSMRRLTAYVLLGMQYDAAALG